MSLLGIVDEVDVQIETVQRLIDGGAVLDPELGAGLGTTQSMAGFQKDLDAAAVACEALDKQLRAINR